MGALAWRQAGELFTCSDDGSICRWQANGESLGQVGLMDSSSRVPQENAWSHTST